MHFPNYNIPRYLYLITPITFYLLYKNDKVYVYQRTLTYFMKRYKTSLYVFENVLFCF